jgi:hypothetical protein
MGIEAANDRIRNDLLKRKMTKETMIEAGPTGAIDASTGEFTAVYGNCEFALMRVLIAYLVDGPQAVVHAGVQ